MSDLVIHELAATLEMARKFVVQNNCFTVSARKEALNRIDQVLSRRAATKHEPNTPAIVAGRGTGENG